jgi:hypothetical protein
MLIPNCSRRRWVRGMGTDAWCVMRGAWCVMRAIINARVGYWGCKPGGFRVGWSLTSILDLSFLILYSSFIF